jgi:hypothetical protein
MISPRIGMQTNMLVHSTSAIMRKARSKCTPLPFYIAIACLEHVRQPVNLYFYKNAICSFEFSLQKVLVHFPAAVFCEEMLNQNIKPSFFTKTDHAG